MPNKNEDKLRRLLSLMDEDSLTKEMFLESFKKVVALVNKVKAENLQNVQKLIAKIESAEAKLKGDNSTDLSTIKAEVKTALSKALDDQSNSLNFIRDNVRSFDKKRVSKDVALVAEAVETALSRLPEIEEFMHPDVKAHRDELETLEGKERLRASAVSGLEELIKKLQPVQKFGRAGGGVTDLGVQASLGRSIKTETPSGAINSSNKAYSVTSNISAVMSFAINGMVIHSSEYSTAGKIITFVTALDSSLSGTSFEIIYV